MRHGGGRQVGLRAKGGAKVGGLPEKGAAPLARRCLSGTCVLAVGYEGAARISCPMGGVRHRSAGAHVPGIQFHCGPIAPVLQPARHHGPVELQLHPILPYVHAGPEPTAACVAQRSREAVALSLNLDRSLIEERGAGGAVVPRAKRLGLCRTSVLRGAR